METNIFQPMQGEYPELKSSGLLSVDDALAFDQGVFFKKNKYRSVYSFDISGETFFIKQFFNFPLKKQILNFFTFGTQKCESDLEWENIQIIRDLKIPTINALARGKRKVGPFEKGGYIITLGLPTQLRLEDYLASLKRTNQNWCVKKYLVSTLASYARKIHQEGYFHKDFYLGHFLVQNENNSIKNMVIYLIDLQRLSRHYFLSNHYMVKDLASLHFSMPSGCVSKTLQIRFLKEYFAVSKFTQKHRRIIRAILKKSTRISMHTEKKLAKKKGNN